MKKDYNVLIIGPRHSGKTVFLSSMYYNLSMPAATKFFLDVVNFNHSKVLVDRFQELASNKKWPEANTNESIDEYVFKCLLRTRQANFEAFRITYYDYSGGRINNANVDDENEYKKILDNADIHLGLLDGERLLRSLREPEYTPEFFIRELDRLIIDLGRIHKENVVVHFLISKWDLLKHHGYTVADVKEHLFKHPRFKDFTDNVIEYNGKIRLIPVSAVGFSFLEFNADGYKPKPHGFLQPYNVEMPLSLALIDHMEMIVKELEEEAAAAESEVNQAQSYHVAPQLTLWERIQRGAGKLASSLSERYSDLSFLDQISHWKSIGDDRIEAAKAEEDRIRTGLKAKLENVMDEKSAAAYVHEVFLANAYRLQQEHPGSLIE